MALVTASELAEYRRRAESGPYRVESDVSVNSPGDWTNIATLAAAFVATPPPVFDPVFEGPWMPDTHGESHHFPDQDRGDVPLTAFFALVAEDTVARDAVWTWLVAQSLAPGTDFTNTDLYDSEALLSGPGADAWFAIQVWLMHLAFGWEHLVHAGAGTQAERDSVLAWLLAGARWRAEPYDTRIGNAHWGSPGGDRATLTPRTEDGSGIWPYFEEAEKTHSEGHITSTYARGYNNRGLAIMTTLGSISVFADHQPGIDLARRYCEEWIQCVMYPDEDFGEFHRSHSNSGAVGGELGYAYTSVSVASIAEFAFVLWRWRGDPSLFDFTTRAGVHGTACEVGDPDKGVLQAHLAMCKFEDDQFERYGNQYTTGDPDHRIDGRTPRDGSAWRAHHTVYRTQANMYYKSDAIKAAYMRDAAAGYEPYWPKSQWSNPGGDFRGLHNFRSPGLLFMYGQMENLPVGLGRLMRSGAEWVTATRYVRSGGAWVGAP